MSKKKKEKQEKHISLRNILALQFQVAGIKFEEGDFDDKSASWLLIKGDLKRVNSEGYDELHRLDIEIGFDYEGDNINQINVFKIPYSLSEDDAIKIFP